jgi:hypothetical protein
MPQSDKLSKFEVWIIEKPELPLNCASIRHFQTCDVKSPWSSIVVVQMCEVIVDKDSSGCG